MPSFTKIGDARKALEAEQKATRRKAQEQQDALRRGYHSTGWQSVTPSSRARVADTPASPPLEPSKPLEVDPNAKPRTTRRTFGVGYGDQ
jgi:hypothetical protein